MNYLPILKSLLVLLLLSGSALLLAQERQGNIVEYFGKEKVERIEEGELLHVFQQGLVLNVMSGRFNSSSTPRDEVFARYLMSNETGIREGQTFDIDFQGEAMQWEKLETDKTNTFQDRRLRSGYLYLSYEAKSARTILFEASGHTRLLINGLPHEGDHYDYGWTLIPVKLQKGKNEFILQGGRFDRMRARLIVPTSARQFTPRDLTLPDVRAEDAEPLLGAIRVINAANSTLKGARITCRRGKAEIETPVPPVSPMSIRKVPFRILFPDLKDGQTTIHYELSLHDLKGKLLATDTIELAVKSKYQHHKRTFLSQIDGSAQYYSVAPASVKDLENPALFLSVHGASVEATNQANAYKQKEWGHIVAPTNRRAFGFAWEDWGRLDALEVLADAERIYQTDPQRTYLTGHSMGGHGTWYLGATYPSRFAAIAPCAGYPDLLAYRDGFFKRMSSMSEEQLGRFGMTKSSLLRLSAEVPTPFDEIVARAGNPSRTLKLKDNYRQLGIYVLHGEKDNVVPTEIARDMRRRLGEFHADFTYYEYPDGTHWYGDHSMDWPPIFDFFQARTIKPSQALDHLSFSTASPGVSDSAHFFRIYQQETQLEISRIEFERKEKRLIVGTENVQAFSIDLGSAGMFGSQVLAVDGQAIAVSDTSAELNLIRSGDSWEKAQTNFSPAEKGPHRNGGFKDAFRHRPVLVYATGGSKAENDWYYNKARFDAETFWYRANGNIEVIADRDFVLTDYPDRNVVLYGNRDNNSAWSKLLLHCPLQVSKGQLSMGELQLSGTAWGAYFIYPRRDSDMASVGVVTASGPEGMKAAYANHYLVNGTTFPDVLIFDEHLLSRGKQALKCAGFWGNDWSVAKGEFVWR